MTGLTACSSCTKRCLSRRSVLASAAAVAAAPLRSLSAPQPPRPVPLLRPLTVQPVLTYATPTRREHTSWREWGGIQTEADAAQEKERIGRELAQLAAADQHVTIRPLIAAKTVEECAAIAKGDHDLALMYAAGGSGRMLETLAAAPWSLMFLRHRSGPVSLWYEIAHPRFLRKTVDEFGQPGFTIHDVIVDDVPEVSWKLRGLYALKNTYGKKVLCIGGPSGWAKGGQKAPEIARTEWKLDLQTVEYSDLEQRIRRARTDDARVQRCAKDANAYLGSRGVQLETSRDFVQRAFLLTDVFRELLVEHGTDAMTVNACMGTIMGISETTACLPLGLLNDEGLMAFCESDFVVIPSGILLRHIADKPVFLNDPTHPHHGIVTLAHCTAPRRLDGRNPEAVRILTHFESDYGAAPKVEMRKGMKLTNLVPDFANRRWVGFEGEVIDNPFLPICRSQVDVAIQGSTEKLLEHMKGFHWMTSYGSYLREAKYALAKAGVELVSIA